MTDADLELFAKIPRSRLTAVVALVARTPDEFEADILAMLEMAEQRGLPGSLVQELHHDARGRVNAVEHTPRWRRQAKGGRKTA
jgi:hypothetical protein